MQMFLHTSRLQEDFSLRSVTNYWKNILHNMWRHLIILFLNLSSFSRGVQEPPRLLIPLTDSSDISFKRWVSSLKCIIFFYRQVRQDVLSAHPSLARHSFHSVRGNVEESKKSNRQIDKTSRHTRLKRNKLTAAYQKRRPQSDAWNTTLRSCKDVCGEICFNKCWTTEMKPSLSNMLA